MYLWHRDSAGLRTASANPTVGQSKNRRTFGRLSKRLARYAGSTRTRRHPRLPFSGNPVDRIGVASLTPFNRKIPAMHYLGLALDIPARKTLMKVGISPRRVRQRAEMAGPC